MRTFFREREHADKRDLEGVEKAEMRVFRAQIDLRDDRVDDHVAVKHQQSDDDPAPVKGVGRFEEIDQTVLRNDEIDNQINGNDRDENVKNHGAADFEFPLLLWGSPRPAVWVGLQSNLLLVQDVYITMIQFPR